ncbi:hypothetical protein CC86DRAFT_381890 [Ophiobolus disseminans]|uniref:Uncharacterized protein n=1 Tax=Ophiobolus disseminans TaxID=1469910 RepID=A0A6A7A139_9PLEO|nr:hypothetical protein CC86DRAFT_381890 [Ophiobolus disseminans]
MSHHSRPTVLTATLPEDRIPSLSLSPPFPTLSQQHVAHGIIPGSPRALESHPTHTSIPAAQTSATITTTLSQLISSPSVPRRSTYPRPSPPGFLYPEAIVPRSVYENSDLIQYHPDTLCNMADGNAIWYLPYGLEMLIFTVMFLGFAWAILVMLINFPPRTWTYFQIESQQIKSRKIVGEKSWWTCMVAWRPWNKQGEEKKERRPFDKPSKFVKLPSISERRASEEAAIAVTSSAQTPSLYMQRNVHLSSPANAHGEAGIELTHRPQHRFPASQNHTYTTHRRATSSPATANRFDLASPPTSPTIASPPNPFLHPPNAHLPIPINPRNSTEWKAQHTQFFSSTPSPGHSSASSSADPDEYPPMNTADIEALEAGTAPLGPRSPTKKRAKDSWADLSLARVEDAVNGWVEKVVRWTDDDRGVREGNVLPRVNGTKVE